MCNPRRIRISATRRIREAWEREVSRVCELSEIVAGEARVRDAMAATVGRPALRALERFLADDCSGWETVEGGYRRNVEGGYARYCTDTHELEIVAVLQEEVRVAAEHREVLTGEIDAELEAEGEGRYYSDGWGGRTKERAEVEAQEDGQRRLDEAAAKSQREAAEKAEEGAADAVEAQARRQAEEKLEATRQRRREELAEQARQHLEAVGTRARQVFNQALSQAYRDAILAYARAHGADNIQCTEDDNVVELEFSFTA
jgi:hypothetical protein